MISHISESEWTGLGDKQTQDAFAGWQLTNPRVFLGRHAADNESLQPVAAAIQYAKCAVARAYDLTGGVGHLLKDPLELMFRSDPNGGLKETLEPWPATRPFVMCVRHTWQSRMKVRDQPDSMAELWRFLSSKPHVGHQVYPARIVG